ncbi:hypothetical protein PspLS_08715 [Pyricularia sp. CBS 133598]|nr:hypothetical protein PspLS_08715 [Pyricularia sp. CBS 133598]
MLWGDFKASWHDPLVRIKEPVSKAELGTKDNTSLIVHHNRVYVMADRYQVKQLMTLSFQKLHRALVHHEVTPIAPEAIVALLKFCYGQPVPEKLRHMIVHDVSCEFQKLWECAAFQDLVEEYGEFSRLILGSLVLRLD